MKTAVGPHSLHSPFVFELFNQVIKPSKKLRIKEIEETRLSLYKDHQLIDVTDFKTNQASRKTISSVAKTSLSQQKFSAFLHLLSEYLNARSILETGTSLGINTLYLASVKEVEVTTIEGSLILKQLAETSFKRLGHENITIESGDVNAVLSRTLHKCNPDLVFLDADHRGKSVLKHVDQIMTLEEIPICIVIHDINWSKDMNQAWQSLIRDDRFPLTLDVFQAGLLFPKKNIEKQHFTLRF